MFCAERLVCVVALVLAGGILPVTSQDTNTPAMEVAQAVMVTAELDFGQKLPTIAEALREVERRYQPAATLRLEHQLYRHFRPAP